MSVRSLPSQIRPRTPIPYSFLSTSNPPCKPGPGNPAQPHEATLPTTEPLRPPRSSFTSSISTSSTSSSSMSIRRNSPLSTTFSAPESLDSATVPSRRNRSGALRAEGAVEREIDLFIHALNPARVHPWTKSPESPPGVELASEEGEAKDRRDKEEVNALPGWMAFTNVETGAQLWIREPDKGKRKESREVLLQSRWSDSTVGGCSEVVDDESDQQGKDGGTIQSRRATRRYLSIQPPTTNSRPRSLLGPEVRTSKKPSPVSPPPPPVRVTEFPPYYTKLPLPPLPPSATSSIATVPASSTASSSKETNNNNNDDTSYLHPLDFPRPLRATQLWNQVTPSSPTYLTLPETKEKNRELEEGGELMMGAKRKTNLEKRIARLITVKEKETLVVGTQENEDEEDEVETLKSEQELEHERWYRYTLVNPRTASKFLS